MAITSVYGRIDVRKEHGARKLRDRLRKGETIDLVIRASLTNDPGAMAEDAESIEFALDILSAEEAA